MLLFSNVLEYGAQTFVFALKKCVEFFIYLNMDQGKNLQNPPYFLSQNFL